MDNSRESVIVKAGNSQVELNDTELTMDIQSELDSFRKTTPNPDDDQVITILEDIINQDEEDFNSSYRNTIISLEKYFSNNGKRKHRMLLKIIQDNFSDEKQEKIQGFNYKLELLYEKISEKRLEEKENVNLEKTEKLIDYLLLEIARMQLRISDLSTIDGLRQQAQSYHDESKDTLKRTAEQERKLFETTEKCYSLESKSIELAIELSNQTSIVKTQQEQLKENRAEVEKLMNENKGFTDRSITMFTIFSAVIITFSGGFNYVTSAISALGDPDIVMNIDNLLLIVAIVGFIMFNLVVSLLYIVSKMIDRPIAMSCSESSPDGIYLCGDNCKCNRKPRSICKLYHKYGYILIVNVIILLVIGYYTGSFGWLYNGISSFIQTALIKV